MMPKEPLTAADARQLAGVPDEVYAAEMCAAAESDIRKAAIAGKREVILHGDFWEHKAYAGSATWKRAAEILTSRGFHVAFHYVERQFVDMGTKVSW